MAQLMIFNSLLKILIFVFQKNAIVLILFSEDVVVAG